MRVIGCKLPVYPAQVEHGVDLSNQMIWRNHLIQIKRIKELTLPDFPPTHHEPPPRIIASTESRVIDRLNKSFATESLVKRTRWTRFPPSVHRLWAAGSGVLGSITSHHLVRHSRQRLGSQKSAA